MLTNVIKVDIISFAVENTVEFFGFGQSNRDDWSAEEEKQKIKNIKKVVDKEN